jgi:hypothetical protein
MTIITNLTHINDDSKEIAQEPIYETGKKENLNVIWSNNN